MEIQTTRVYIFNNGTRIDLEKITAIGPLEKNEHSQIFIPVYFTGNNKPINVILGYSIGETDPEKKAKIQLNYTQFLEAYDKFIFEKTLSKKS